MASPVGPDRNGANGHHSAPGSAALSGPGSSATRGTRHLIAQNDWRQRTRSLGAEGGHSILGLAFGLSGSPDSDTSTEDIAGRVNQQFRFSGKRQ